MVPPECSFHSQTFATKASRPMSRRPMLPVRASSRSTTIWVAMPAWSRPGCQRTSKPRIRCQRARMSIRVWLKAWPMWSEPVTFGGGSSIEKGSAPGLALAPARKASAASQRALIAGSAVAASKVLSIGTSVAPRRACLSPGSRRGKGPPGPRKPAALAFGRHGGVSTTAATLFGQDAIRGRLRHRIRCAGSLWGSDRWTFRDAW